MSVFFVPPLDDDQNSTISKTTTTIFEETVAVDLIPVTNSGPGNSFWKAFECFREKQ